MALTAHWATATLAMALAGCISARPAATAPAGAEGSAQAKPAPKPEEGAEALRQRRAVSRVLQDFRESLEGVAARRVIELLDESFEDFPRFEDAVTALLRQTLERRVFLRESSWDVKGDHASVTVDAEMILTARTRARTEHRRRERIQFDFRRGPKGWKIIGISPRSFFAP